jgi:hypothetical protein
LTGQKNRNDSNERIEGLRRRDVIKGAAAAGLSVATGAHALVNAAEDSAAPDSASQNLILRENAKPGTRDWMLTNTRIDPKTWWRCPWIEGYCSEMSVRAGDTLRIMVSTNPLSEFSLEIFRTGYYGGTGGRFMKRFDSLPGKTQTDPPIATALSIRIMHAEDVWNHDAFCDYCDRWMTEDDTEHVKILKEHAGMVIDGAKRQGQTWDPWVDAMYKRDRSALPAAKPITFVSPDPYPAKPRSARPDRTRGRERRRLERPDDRRIRQD